MLGDVEGNDYAYYTRGLSQRSGETILPEKRASNVRDYTG